MLPNTEHLPCSADLSPADLDLERSRSLSGTTRRLSPVPAEWADRFTPEEWDAYLREKFQCYHSYAALLSPEGYLQGARHSNME